MSLWNSSHNAHLSLQSILASIENKLIIGSLPLKKCICTTPQGSMDISPMLVFSIPTTSNCTHLLMKGKKHLWKFGMKIQSCYFMNAECAQFLTVVFTNCKLIPWWFHMGKAIFYLNPFCPQIAASILCCLFSTKWDLYKSLICIEMILGCQFFSNSSWFFVILVDGKITAQPHMLFFKFDFFQSNHEVYHISI